MVVDGELPVYSFHSVVFIIRYVVVAVIHVSFEVARIVRVLGRILICHGACRLPCDSAVGKVPSWWPCQLEGDRLRSSCLVHYLEPKADSSWRWGAFPLGFCSSQFLLRIHNLSIASASNTQLKDNSLSETFHDVECFAEGVSMKGKKNEAIKNPE